MIQVTSGFDAVAWRRFRVGAPMQDPDWLSIMSTRLPGPAYTIEYGDELAFIGAVVSDPDAYEAYNPYAILWRPDPVFEFGHDQARRDRLARRPPDPGVTLPALVLVAPGYWGDPIGPAGDDPHAVQACLRALEAWSHDHAVASISVLYTRRSTDVMRTAFAALGGVSYPLTERWLLPVWWKDWDGYLAGLPIARSREVRRELRRAADAGFHPGQIGPRHYLEHILDARCALLERYGHAADRSAESRRLHGLLDAFGDRVTAYAALRDGEPVAMSLGLRHERALHMVYAGALGAGRPAPFGHFLATFYAVFQHICAADTDEIDYGIGHGTGKALRGCRPTLMFGHTHGVGAERGELLRQGGRLLDVRP
jgi:hypothetical protein